MPSYNKEQYITQAIDSVLAQQTNFNVTLIITDDGSTDKTLEIVNDYIKKYPNKIVLLPSEKNQGLLSNIIKAYEYLIKNKSEYFCCLDADDFLTDDKFYQNAIDFLDKNKDFNIYAAKTSVLFPDGKTVVSRPADGITFVDSTFMDMLNGTAVLGNTISSVFRNCVLNKELIEKMKQYVGDHYSEHSFREDDFRDRIHLENGKVHFVYDIVGAYRSTPNGLFQGSNDLKRILLKIRAFIDMYYFFDKKYPEFINLALKQLERIDNEAVKSDLNRLFKYKTQDILELCSVIAELKKHDDAYVSGIIERVRGRHTNFLEKIFSIKNYDESHRIMRILGIKIKLRKNKVQ